MVTLMIIFPYIKFSTKGIEIRAGQAPVHKYIDHLADLVVTGKVKLNDIITHRMPLTDAPKAYKIFDEKKR